ncbi:MAG: type II secretion system protein GspL [Rubrivivax sp.]
MSLLAIQLPARPRPPSAPAGADTPPAEFDYVLSPDRRTVGATGRATPARLPKADIVVAVMADTDVSWHRVTVPKAPRARLRAALGALLEDTLLDDDETTHLALAPKAAAGQNVWVAAVRRPWLKALLDTLESAGVPVERVMPASSPDDGPRVHFFTDGPAEGSLTLAIAHADGAATVRANGTLARTLLPSGGAKVRWTATPAAAAAAERWLGGPVALRTEPERTLRATRTSWNLRQFDLAPKNRGMLALREGWRSFVSEDWRSVRWGLATLAGASVLGLNLAAWRQEQVIDAKRAEMTALLRAAHPGVRAVIDAPAQMLRETERLRAAAGKPGDTDLEVLLGAAAAAWPDGQGPVQTLKFEGGRLVLAAPGWGEPQLAQFRDRLRPVGLDVEMAEGRVTLLRSARGVS